MALATAVMAAGTVGLLAPAARGATVLGDSTVEGSSDYNPPALADAFPSVAGATTTVGSITVYVDYGSTSTRLFAGIYANKSGKPGTLLGQGSVLNPTEDSWVTVPIPSVQVTAGSTYWIAILSPKGTGQLGFRDHGNGGTVTLTAAQGSNGQLPTNWVTKQSYAQGPVSAYASSSLPGPAISAVQAVAVGSTSATVTWTTDTPSSSQVRYGTSPALGSATTLDSTPVTSHSQTLSGLSPGTGYDFAVVSTDSTGTTNTSATFSTGTLGGTAASVGQWGPDMAWPLVAVHLNVLHNGKLLLWDGWQTPTPTEVWDPGNQSFTTVTNPDGLFCSGTVQLADGRILVAGGHDQGTGYVETGVADTNIFDPATNTWTRVASMHHARWYPSMTLLPDGRVLAISGEDVPGHWVDTPEVYDPVANTWTELAGVSTAGVHEPEYPLSYVLPSGNVLVVAADTGQAYELNVATQAWTAVGAASSVTNGSADMYRPGQVLFSGGGNIAVDTNPARQNAQTLDATAAAPSWVTTGSMLSPRYEHTMVNLPDGTVFAMGGAAVTSQQTTNDTLTSEIWNPAAGAFTVMSPQAEGRIYHSTAALLPDGRVLVAGGGRYNNAVDHYSAQYFSPPYLFKGPRPSITSAPASAAYGSQITVATPDAATISSAVLIDLANDTHTTDMAQRSVPLAFSAGAGSLAVSMPSAAATAPPGYYMLFVVNSSGVPSTAAIVQLGGSGGSGDTTPPSVAMTAPAASATLSGTTTVTASASDNVAVGSVQFLLDGAPLGSPVTASPYSVPWNTATAANGTHTVSARATDTSGNQATSTPVSVTVANAGPPPTGPTLDAKVSGHHAGPVTTAALTTATPGDLLVALASSDGPGPGQSLTVTGGGLAWSRVAQANAEPGTAEVWTARAAGTLAGATFTATQSTPGYDADLTVAAYSGAAGIGASATAGSTGAPAATLTTTAAGSLVVASGSDWDNPIGRTVAAGQALLDQWVDSHAGDTFWSQATTAVTGAAGSTVTMKDTAPTGDVYNMATAEITAQPAAPKAATPTATAPAPSGAGAGVAGDVVDPTAAARAALTKALATPANAPAGVVKVLPDLSAGGTPLKIDGTNRLVYWCSLGLIHGTLASILVAPGPQWPANPSRRPDPRTPAGLPVGLTAAVVAVPVLSLRPRRRDVRP